jgi:beta-xylosidase
VAHGFGHIVSIERLTPDLLSTTRVNVTGLFPDDFVESPSLFKRESVYYLTYGSCCCGCQEDGGQVVFTAPAVAGPWVRQQPHSDINCNDADAEICGGYSRRDGQYAELTTRTGNKIKI